jgi:hypothetical protein
MKLRLGPLPLRALVASLSLVGCSTETGAAGTRAELEVIHNGRLDSDCSEPRTYIAVVAEGGCVEVAAEGGRWVPSPLFEDAPPEANACVYSWISEADASPDRVALYAFVHPFTTGALTPSCGDAARVREDIVVEPIPSLDPFGMAGSVGCDVCGIVKRGKLWVVLPPERVFSKQVGVQLTNGTMAAFKINADEGTRAAVVTLPPTEPGVAYVEGPVTIF